MRTTATVLFLILACLSLATASSYHTVKPIVVDDALPENPVVAERPPAPRSMLVLPPGTVLDSSYYDWQHNGSLNRRVWVNDDGSIHATFMKSPDEGFVERGMIYYYADNTGGPFFPSGDVGTFRNGFGALSSYPTSYETGAIAVVSTHNFGTGASFVYVDAFQGLGAFSALITDSTEQVVWPKPSVNSDGSIMAIGTLNNGLFVNDIAANVAYDRAPDIVTGFSQSWTWFGQDVARWKDGDMQWPSIASGGDGRVGVAIVDFAADVHFYESTDDGVSFEETVITNAAEDTVGLPEEPDSAATVFLPWINGEVTYVGEEPHVVWTGLQGANVGGVVLFDYRTRILHWSPSTGIDTVVVSENQSAVPSEVDTYVNPGSNHTSIDWAQIGASPAGDVLSIVYVAFDADDVDPGNGIAFGDIMGVYSVDGGESWSEPVNISNPDGMYPGTDDRYPSISPLNHETALLPGMDAYLVYQTDDTGGSFLQGEEGANWDYFLFTGVDFDVSGIEDGGREQGGVPRAYSLHQNYPNPFNPQTTVSFEVPEGAGQVTLGVYDARGRLVRTLFSGVKEPGEHRITWDGTGERGESAASGIYFLRMTGTRSSDTIKMLLMK